MAILYGYFDESGKKNDHPVVTIGCVCVTQPKLQQFDNAWNILLRKYGLRALHMKRASRLSEQCGPKMPRKQTYDERIDALIPFADCINEHLELGLIQALDIQGFNAMKVYLSSANIKDPDDPFHIAFVRAMLELVGYAHNDDHISLICDDDKETALDCYRHYRGVCGVYAKIQDRMISLTFANDEYFPALQASDMVAFLSRLEAKSRFYGDKYDFKRLFDLLTKERNATTMKWLSCFVAKEKMGNLGKSMAEVLRKHAKTRK